MRSPIRRPEMRRRIALPIPALIAIVAVGCHKSPEATTPAALPTATVRVLAVESRRRVATEDVVATVRPKLRAVMEAKVSSRIVQMPVTLGQPVKAGELLAQLDAQEIQARLDQALAQREQYRRDTERLRELLKDNAVSRQEFETVESRHRVATAAVTEAETMLAYTRVIAPFAGVITRKHADVGDLAAPGKPLVEMEDPLSLRLEADVPETAINNIAIGNVLRVRIPARTNDLAATVIEVAPAADPGSRTFLVKCDLPKASGLRSGQFGRLAVPLGEVSGLRVPAAAIVQRGQMELVFVVHDQRARLRIVKSGKRIGDEVEVLSGLQAGEPLVIEGAAGLRDGQPLNVTR